MGCQRLGARWVRRLRRITGEDVIAGWGWGSYMHAFVTADHHHGWYDLRDKVWGWDEETIGSTTHYDSCNDRWPGFREGSNAEQGQV